MGVWGRVGWEEGGLWVGWEEGGLWVCGEVWAGRRGGCGWAGRCGWVLSAIFSRSVLILLVNSYCVMDLRIPLFSRVKYFLPHRMKNDMDLSLARKVEVND